MSDTAWFLLIVLLSLLLGALLFFGSGCFYVRKNQILIFEKLYQFHAVRTHGLYFFFPFLVRRVAKYSALPATMVGKYRDFRITITYQICDAKAYHYSGHALESSIQENLKKDIPKTLGDIETCIQTCATSIGISILSFKGEQL